jgi:hypothetical protein
MKRTPIIRRSPIRRKAVVKHTAAFFERKKERQAELYRRRKLKAELLLECPTDSQGRRLCPLCGKLPDFRGLQLVHKKALSAGGKTTKDNCCILCAKCHFVTYHHEKETGINARKT